MSDPSDGPRAVLEIGKILDRGKVTKLEPIDGGDRKLVIDALREMADELEAGKDDSPPVGYAVVIACADGGVSFRWSGNEVRTIGALEYAKHTVISVWREMEERDPR